MQGLQSTDFEEEKTSMNARVKPINNLKYLKPGEKVASKSI